MSVLFNYLKKYDIDITDEAINKLDTYIYELMRWNKVFNLTGFKELDQVAEKNIIDSLLIKDFLIGNSILDVGTGAGLPGIPLAITRSEIDFTLVDSSQKRMTFLQNVVSLLGITNVNLVCSRVEDLNGSFSGITCRAFASLDKIVYSVKHLLSDDGAILAMKGQLNKAELENIPACSYIYKTLSLSKGGVMGDRHLIVVKRTV